jgi:hypothetical protein
MSNKLKKTKDENNNKKMKTFLIITVLLSFSIPCNAQQKVKNEKLENSIKIAPIFMHGKGIGGSGSLGQSVSLSTDEAKNIIFGELKNYGIKMDTVDYPEIKFKAVPIADACYRDWLYEDDLPKTVDVELAMTGYSKELNLAIQYVSAGVFSKFRTPDYSCTTTAYSFHTKKTAEIIREEMVLCGKMNAGIFYDPAVYVVDFLSIQREKEARDEAERLLLAQVNNFIKWLQSEKIIKKKIKQKNKKNTCR